MIQPTIIFTSINPDFYTNALGETGDHVEQGFEYNSGTNPHFLDIEDIRELNHLAHA